MGSEMCNRDKYEDYLIEEQYMDKIEEPFDLEQEYDKWDDYSDCIDSDLEYKEYQQEQFRKEDSIEGPMSLSLIHISEPTRLLSISYAVFCLKKKTHTLNQ